MRAYILWVFVLLSAAMPPAPARADGERAGAFDYYVLALSWSSAWCKTTGDAQGDDQCRAGRGLGFVLHGLWPQGADGAEPAYCRTVMRDPSRAQTRDATDVFPSAGLAFYEWKKHGRCSGLSADDYFATARRAVQSIRVPPVLMQVRRDLTLAPQVIVDAFVQANPQLGADSIAVTCPSGMIAEVRVCLAKDLSPTPCAPDIRSCPLPRADLPALR
ncbi:MAG: ribonuclease T [Rhodobacteraceae bacterium]|nr:ribonuclease T [Paracoccaceae bacterium]